MSSRVLHGITADSHQLLPQQSIAHSGGQSSEVAPRSIGVPPAAYKQRMKDTDRPGMPTGAVLSARLVFNRLYREHMNTGAPSSEDYPVYTEMANAAKNLIRQYLYQKMELDRGDRTYTSIKVEYASQLLHLKKKVAETFPVLSAAQNFWIVTEFIKEAMQRDRKAKVEASKRESRRRSEGASGSAATGTCGEENGGIEVVVQGAVPDAAQAASVQRLSNGDPAPQNRRSEGDITRLRQTAGGHTSNRTAPESSILGRNRDRLVERHGGCVEKDDVNERESGRPGKRSKGKRVSRKRVNFDSGDGEEDLVAPRLSTPPKKGKKRRKTGGRAHPRAHRYGTNHDSGISEQSESCSESSESSEHSITAKTNKRLGGSRSRKSVHVVKAMRP